MFDPQRRAQRRVGIDAVVLEQASDRDLVSDERLCVVHARLYFGRLGRDAISLRHTQVLRGAGVRTSSLECREDGDFGARRDQDLVSAWRGSICFSGESGRDRRPSRLCCHRISRLPAQKDAGGNDAQLPFKVSDDPAGPPTPPRVLNEQDQLLALILRKWSG